MGDVSPRVEIRIYTPRSSKTIQLTAFTDQQILPGASFLYNSYSACEDSPVPSFDGLISLVLNKLMDVF